MSTRLEPTFSRSSEATRALSLRGAVRGRRTGKKKPVNDEIYHVLFLCTGNSARSILAEAILGRLGTGRFRAHSAGSHPKGRVHPLAIEVLQERGYDTTGLRSKSWDEFGGGGAPPLDLVVTVCDDAAGEACPVWPGRPVTAHWGLPDPAAFAGSEAEQRECFRRACLELERRIDRFVGLDPAALDGASLRARLDEIAEESTPAAENG